jgi:hypothetical protein
MILRVHLKVYKQYHDFFSKIRRGMPAKVMIINKQPAQFKSYFIKKMERKDHLQLDDLRFKKVGRATARVARTISAVGSF